MVLLLQQSEQTKSRVENRVKMMAPHMPHSLEIMAPGIYLCEIFVHLTYNWLFFAALFGVSYQKFWVKFTYKNIMDFKNKMMTKKTKETECIVWYNFY